MAFLTYIINAISSSVTQIYAIFFQNSRILSIKKFDLDIFTLLINIFLILCIAQQWNKVQVSCWSH